MSIWGLIFFAAKLKIFEPNHIHKKNHRKKKMKGLCMVCVCMVVIRNQGPGKSQPVFLDYGH